MATDTPDSIAGYRLDEQIDEGSMGTIHRAHQEALDRSVVVKILHEDICANLQDEDNFKQAALKLTELHHTGIARLYETGEDEGRYFLAMEDVEGIDLRNLLSKEGILEEDQVLHIAQKVAEALAFAWDREKIFHRDLRPGHIIVQEDGDPKLIDLGIVQLQDQVDDAGTEGIVCMPAYTAPELITGKGETDFHADMFALGAIMYQMFTGSEPFGDREAQEQLEAQLRDTLADPRRVNPGIRHSTIMFLRKLMARKPANRCASWQEVIADLEALQQGEAPESLPGPEVNSVIAYDEELAEEQHAKVTQRVEMVRTGRIKLVDKGAAQRPTTTSFPSSISQKKSKAPLIIVGMMLLGVIGAGSWILSNQKKPDPAPNAGGAGTIDKPGAETQARTLLGEAHAFAQENPRALDLIMQKFQAVTDAWPQTTAGETARQEIERIEQQKQQAVEEVLLQLKGQSDALVEAGKFDEAMQLYVAYTGPMSRETKDARDAVRADIQEKKRINDSLTGPGPGPGDVDPPTGGGDELPEEVAKAVETAREAWKQESAELAELHELLKTKYLRAMERNREYAREKGMLEAVLAADEEKRRFEESGGQFLTEVPDRIDPLIKKVLDEVAKQATPLYKSQTLAERSINAKVIKAIEARVMELTKTDQIDAALSLRKYSEAIKNLSSPEIKMLMEGRVPTMLKHL